MDCFNSLGSQREGGLGDAFRKLAWDKLLLPIAPLVASLTGTQEFRRCVPVGEIEEAGNDTGVCPRGRAHCGSFALRVFISLLQAGILGRSQGRVSAEYSSVFQVYTFRVVVPTEQTVTGQGFVSHCNWSWLHPPGLTAPLGLELKHN